MFGRNSNNELPFFSNKFLLFIFYYGAFLLFSIATISSAKDMIMNDQMCPKLTLNKDKEDQIFFINKNLKIMSIPAADIVKSPDPSLQEDIPCSFMDSNLGRTTGLLKVEVKAAQFTKTEWNFTNSLDCRNFVKFRLVNDKTTTNLTQLCKMYKTYSSNIDYENNNISKPHTSPVSIWSTGNKMGFSLPLPEPFLNPNKDLKSYPGYLQVVYKVHYSLSDCIINVQQYSLNPVAKLCNSSSMKHQVCGSYSCASQHRILKQLGFLPYDVIVDLSYFSDKNNLKKYDYELLKNYDVERRDGDYFFKPKPRNYHAALFSGMTRAISFLFILSVLISCISYQLRPYLQAPSSSFDQDFVHDRVAERPRRCYRNSTSHPFTRPSNEEIPMEHSISNLNIRSNRPRRYFHHGNQRTAPSSTTNLPSYGNHMVPGQVIGEAPPPYDCVQIEPPSYDATITRDRTNITNNDSQIIIPTSDDATPNNNNANNNSSNNPTNK